MLYNFVNAQEMAREHPDTFRVPPHEHIMALRVGDYIKVAIAKERFWVEVTCAPTKQVPDIVGRVRNQLVFTHVHGYVYDDTVTVGPQNVFEVKKQEDAVFVVNERGNIRKTHEKCN